MKRFALVGLASLLALVGGLGCENGDDGGGACGAVVSQVKVEARAGSVQPDGAVTIYGTVAWSNADAGAELTVRAVYVAGVPVSQSGTDFNYRSWVVTVPQDRIAAYGAGARQATLPVVAYLHGGCTATPVASEEPVIANLAVNDAGSGTVAEDASVSDAEAPDAGDH